MKFDKEKYKRRLIDEKLELYLTLFGAISIEGPKWCGKTWTGQNQARTVKFMTDKNEIKLAQSNPRYVFSDDRPQLIDEWQLAPSIWDAVRHECDASDRKGNFILTGSTTLDKEDEDEVFHSGAGRIATLKMFPMSLYESGDSSGEVSIDDMYLGKEYGGQVNPGTLDKLAKLIVRGGWPENVERIENMEYIPKEYIEAVINKDIHERKDRKRDSNKMRTLLKSLARHESSTAGYDTIVKDIEEYENGAESIKSRKTVADYIGVLDALYLTNNQEAFSVNYRSSKRVGKSPKRHLVDPSLSCALLGLSEEKLMGDWETFGLMFEALVERDLSIYMNYLEGKVYHFRDNGSGDEIDAILEFKDGSYAAVEVKLSYRGIEEAKKSLLKFYENVNKKKPKFMCIIVGDFNAAIKDPETGIYIVPITALKP